jgi:PAS domain S-box-containing protein
MPETMSELLTDRILVVDDDANIRSLIRRMLGREGYTIREASDGQEALERCRQFRPHVVLLDVLMPIMNGFEVCAHLQSLPDPERPPVLMITSLADQESIDRAFAVGAVDHISKPIEWHVLRRRVRHVVEAKKNEDALRNARDELERRVIERTAELEQSNAALREEIIARQQAEDQQRALSASLRQAHDELEARVQQRTAQLAEANAMLQAEIGERSRAKQALEEERNQLRTLIDNLPDYIFIKDLEGRFVISNTAHTRAVVKDHDIVGKTALDTFPQDLALQYHADDQAVIQTGQPLVNVERKTIDAEGNERWVLTTKVPLHDRYGQIAGLVGMSRDITKRKQIEETLRISEERFRGAFDNAPIGLSLVAPDGRYLMVNAALCDIVGYTETELLSKTYQEITHSDDVDADVRQAQQVLDGEIRSYQMEKKYIHKDGHLVWVLLSVSLVRSALGEPLYFISQVQDITDRKELEAEIHEHREHLARIVEHRTAALTIINESLQEEIADRKKVEEQLRQANEHVSLLLESAPFVTYTARFDAQSSTTYMGRSVTSITGFSPEDFVSDATLWAARIHPSDRPQALDALRQMSDRGFNEREYRWKVADGTYRWFLDVARLVEMSDGEKHLVGVWYDISDRKRTEEALQRSEQQIRRITDNMLDIICQTDMAGIVQYASPSCAEMLGYRPDTMVGQSIYAWIHPDDVERVKDGVQTKGQVEYRYRHADGHYIWLETLSSLLFENSADPTSIIFASRDVTERKRAQRELEELNRLKTEFLTTAAHELRTPLTSIRGFSEILLTRALDTNRQRHFLGLINEQATQLGDIINDLLDVSRLEAKRRLTLSMEPVQLPELVQHVMKPFSESATGHRFELEGLEDCPPLVADPLRLSQVLKNLLSNAVKYSPDGGAVTLRAESIADYLRLSVQDEGIGMTQEQQAHLFEKFYRADASNTAVNGTGLGLAISKLIVELHGGTIWAESEFGAGTTFYFTLPLASPKTPEAM